MKHEVEAGTDAASLLLFDPLTLPDEFDAANRDGDPTEILNDLHDQGRLFWINTGGDGGFLLHAFVDEEPNEDIRPYLRDPETTEQFIVASGRIFFMGAEYGYRNDDSQFKRYPGMGGSFPAENGTYTMTLYRTEYPDGIHEERFRQRSTRAQQLVHGTFSFLMAAAVLSVITALIAFFIASWATWFTYFLPAAALAILAPMLFSRLSVFQSADIIWKAVNNELPSMVATLSRTAS
jgi:hypothetical protein